MIFFRSVIGETSAIFKIFDFARGGEDADEGQEGYGHRGERRTGNGLQQGTAAQRSFCENYLICIVLC